MTMAEYYSSNGVDRYIEPLLPAFGYAVDVGANDGVFFSNTKRLEDRGWLVLCVEPNPFLTPGGKAERKLWRSVACGAEDAEEHEFGIYGSHPYASASSLCRQSRYYKDTLEPLRVVNVKVRTLDRLLEEAGFPRVDLVTIDVEGWEMDVLKGFSVEYWKPRIIVVEDYGQGYDLKFDGYVEHPKLEFDRIFVRDGE